MLLGAPGAGKGTQARFLAERLGVPRVASGDLFRAAIERRTKLGLRARTYMDRGELVPDGITIEMVAQRVSLSDCADGVILDGFPRTLEQARALDDLLEVQGRRVDAVVYIRVPEGVLLERLAGRWTCASCGAIYHRQHSPEKVRGVCDLDGGRLFQRSDDTPSTQSHRIAVYIDQTAPLREYYREKDTLVEVDGAQHIESVRRAIEHAIRGVMRADAEQ